jgi:hypothetical protein
MDRKKQDQGVYLYKEGRFEPYRLGWYDYLLAFGVFLVALVNFVRTVTPSICAGDSGELTSAVYLMGAAHPPGYPLYCLLGKLFTFLPFRNVAFRVNFLSVFFGAGTVGVAYLVMAKLLGFNTAKGFDLRVQLPATTAALVLAFTETLWAQAVIAEVYTLCAFFMPVLMLILIVWMENVVRENAAGGRFYAGARYLLVYAWVFGIGMGDHQIILGIAFPTIVFILTVIALYVVDPKPYPEKRLTQAYILPIVFGPLLAFPVPEGTLFGFALAGAFAGFLFVRAIWKRAGSSEYVAEWILFAVAFAIAAIIAEEAVRRNIIMPRFTDEKQFYRGVAGVIFLIAVFYGYTAMFRALRGRDREDFFSEYVTVVGHMLSLFCLALVLNGWMVIRGPRANPKFETKELLSWGKMDTAWEIIPHVLRKQYGGMNQNEHTVAIHLYQLVVWFRWFVKQFTILPIPFILLGAYHEFRKNKLMFLFNGTFFFFNTLALLYYIRPKFTPRDLFFAEVFYIASYVVCAVWLAYGIQYAMDLVGRYAEKRSASRGEAGAPGAAEGGEV